MEKPKISQLVAEWNHREILFPKCILFSVQGKDTDYVLRQDIDYMIVNYMDSTGCTSCKLQLQKWIEIIREVDSLLGKRVEFFFCFHPQNRKILSHLLSRDDFTLPICIDDNNEFYQLNHFPQDLAFQSFLLNAEHEVLAIGNPAHNSKVRELYMKIIQKKSIDTTDNKRIVRTEVVINKTSASLGSFNWQEKQKTTFTLKNIGDKPLVIQNVDTSCGCTTVSYSQEPVQSGKEIKLDITYKAEYPEHFCKTITIYCNIESSPIRLTISGDAK